MIQNIFNVILEKLLPKITVAALIGTTLVTSGVAGAKLLKQTAPPDKVSASTFSDESLGLKELPDNGPTPENRTNFAEISGNLPTVKPKAKTPVSAGSFVFPTSIPAIPTGPSSPNNQNPNACIISLFGKQYDVAPLRSTHSGGDIFACNTDMTAVYQGKHGTNVSRMQPYIYNGNGTSISGSGANPTGSSGTNGSITGGSQIGSREDDHDGDDESDRIEIQREPEETEHTKQSGSSE